MNTFVQIVEQHKTINQGLPYPWRMDLYKKCSASPPMHYMKVRMKAEGPRYLLEHFKYNGKLLDELCHKID